MYNFKIDYAEGAHPNVIKKLVETNLEQLAGYGDDIYSAEAKQALKSAMKRPDASVFFVSGGTQANLLVISFLLRPHEAVISATTGHIHANEAGAIEATGHKVIGVPTDDGKLTPQQIETTVQSYQLRPHVVKPKVVYISNSTELGSIYKKHELLALYNFCQERNLYLFLDGARLGHALTARDNDLTLADIAAYTHAFYMGATKNGGLIGEAIIFQKPELAEEFDYSLKQKGALLAKGRLIGIQFLELFRDNLYFELADHANKMAGKLAAAFEEKGHSFLTPAATNQVFPIVSKTLSKELSKDYEFYSWRNIDEDHEAIRLMTSWATDENEVEGFISKLKAITKAAESK